jgi:hypothetical protein
MGKKIKLTPYDPDKYRDRLNKRLWKESGCKTAEEFSDWHFRRLHKLEEDLKASGLGVVDFILSRRKVSKVS